MPTVVRPSWMVVSAEGYAHSRGIGPKRGAYWLSADITLRTSAGRVSEPIQLDAGGASAELNGAARLELRLPPGWAPEIVTYTNRDGKTVTEVHVRPPDDRPEAIEGLRS